jgi:hypothetical protein
MKKHTVGLVQPLLLCQGGIEGNVQGILFVRWYQHRCDTFPTGTALLAAAIPLLALASLAMADNIRALTVGTMQDLEDHEPLNHIGVAELRDAHRG